MTNHEMITVMGATGHVGRGITEKLLDRGFGVRPVARAAGVDLDDPESLRRAFAGSHAAFILLPFDVQAPDLRVREAAFRRAICAAVEDSSVQKVVLLSSLNADLRLGTSLGAALLEDELADTGVPHMVVLRAGWIMENFLAGVPVEPAVEGGVFSTPFGRQRAMPMISASDVAQRAVDFLTHQIRGRRDIVELHGGGDYSFPDATAILGAALGVPDLRYERIDYAEARLSMVTNGLSQSFADALIETARSFNAGDIWAKEDRATGNSSPTTLEEWAAQTFRSAPDNWGRRAARQ